MKLIPIFGLFFVAPSLAMEEPGDTQAGLTRSDTCDLLVYSQGHERYMQLNQNSELINTALLSKLFQTITAIESCLEKTLRTAGVSPIVAYWRKDIFCPSQNQIYFNGKVAPIIEIISDSEQQITLVFKTPFGDKPSLSFFLSDEKRAVFLKEISEFVKIDIIDQSRNKALYRILEFNAAGVKICFPYDEIRAKASNQFFSSITIRQIRLDLEKEKTVL